MIKNKIMTKEELTNKLKRENATIKVNSREEKQFFIDFLGLKDVYAHTFKSYKYIRLDKYSGNGKLNFFYSKAGEKTEYNANSIIEKIKMSKKIPVELTPEELVVLTAVYRDIDVYRIPTKRANLIDMHDLNINKNIYKTVEYQNLFLKLLKIVKDNQNLFAPEIKKYTFANGLEANIDEENGKVEIGCRKYGIKQLETKIKTLISVENIDKIEIESKEFYIRELKELLEILEKS